MNWSTTRSYRQRCHFLASSDFAYWPFANKSIPGSPNWSDTNLPCTFNFELLRTQCRWITNARCACAWHSEADGPPSLHMEHLGYIFWVLAWCSPAYFRAMIGRFSAVVWGILQDGDNVCYLGLQCLHWSYIPTSCVHFYLMYTYACKLTWLDAWFTRHVWRCNC